MTFLIAGHVPLKVNHGRVGERIDLKHARHPQGYRFGQPLVTAVNRPHHGFPVYLALKMGNSSFGKTVINTHLPGLGFNPVPKFVLIPRRRCKTQGQHGLVAGNQPRIFMNKNVGGIKAVFCSETPVRINDPAEYSYPAILV